MTAMRRKEEAREESCRPLIDLPPWLDSSESSSDRATQASTRISAALRSVDLD